MRGEPENEWAALGAAHEKVGKIPESQIVERVSGVEPPSLPWQGSVIAVIRHPPDGAAGQTCTGDPSFFRAVLYCLSYRGVVEGNRACGRYRT